MKLSSLLIIVCILSVTVSSCSKDNYDAPGSFFTGRIVYQGTPIDVQYNEVRFQLWQSGFGKLTPIDVIIKPDGSFSSLLFNGSYKLSFPGGQGPYMTLHNGSSKDTLDIEINGNKNMDINVVPYYMVRNPQFSVNNRNVTGTFSLEKIITDANAKNIERVELYLNNTAFVSPLGGSQIAMTSLQGSQIADMNNISLNVAIPTMTRTQSYIFARIGVKISGVDDLLFSPVKELTF